MLILDIKNLIIITEDKKMFGKKKQLQQEVNDLQEKNETLFARIVKLEDLNKRLKDKYDFLEEEYHQLKLEKDSYQAKVEHIQELNRKRQRRYQENKKNK